MDRKQDTITRGGSSEKWIDGRRRNKRHGVIFIQRDPGSEESGCEEPLFPKPRQAKPRRMIVVLVTD